MKLLCVFVIFLCFYGKAQASNEYDAYITEAAETYGVDFNLIKSVIRAESAFVSTATSGPGAQGLMQLMPATAAELGVTNSLDPQDNINGGTKYLSQLLTRYNGDVVLTLAAYNAGMGRVEDYGNRVPPYRETVGYIKKISGFLGEYGSSTLNTTGLPTRFVTRASTAPTATSSAGSSAGVNIILPGDADVSAAFEEAVNIAPSSIKAGIQALLIFIVLIWLSWHTLMTFNEVRANSLGLDQAAVSFVRALILMAILFSFIT